MRLRTYIINLKDRIDRKQHILQEFAKYPEFDISIFNAIKAKSGAHGLFQSVKAIIRQAQKAKDKYVIICEDDHIFTDQYNYEELVSLIKTGVMSDFDILLGGPSNIHDAFLIDEKLAWLSGFSGTQFIIIFERFYSIKISSLQSLALRSFSATVLVAAVVATFTVLPVLRSSTLFAIACASLP